MMGLEVRDGRAYYYAKHRVGREVLSVYLGAGVLALAARELAEVDRAETAEARAAWEAKRRAMDDEESAVAAAIVDIDRAVSRSLESAGYHRPSRKLMWLRRQPRGDAMSRAGAPARRSAPPAREIRAAVELAETMGMTSGGVAMALMDEFRDLVERHPHELAEATADRSPAAELVARIAGQLESSDVGRELLLARVRAVRDELAGPGPTPIESHLADAATLAWIDFCRCAIEREDLGDVPLQKVAYFDARADRAHKRYVRSLRALAAVRKLPAVPIRIVAGVAHVAQQQVNATAPAGAIGARPGLERRRSEEFHPGRPGSKVGSTPG